MDKGIDKYLQEIARMKDPGKLFKSVTDAIRTNEVMNRHLSIIDTVTKVNSFQRQLDALKPIAFLDNRDLIWNDPIAGNWSQNIIKNKALEFYTSNLAFQEIHKGIILSRMPNNIIGFPLLKSFAELNRAQQFSGVFDAKFADLGWGNNAGKISRIISSHSKFNQNFLKFDYDMSAIADNEEVDDKTIITPTLQITEAKKIKEMIYDIYKNNANLFNIQPRQFEELIAELLEQKGYTAELTKQTRDGGYDIIALKSDSGMQLKYLVECKRYRRNLKIGVDIIRSFSHVVRTENANCRLPQKLAGLKV